MVPRPLCMACAALACASAVAQPYPSKPVRNILTVSGGGEANARIVAERLAGFLGVPVVVESQPGAGGAIGATTVSRAAPDGYTILYGTTGSMVLRQFVVKDQPYEVLRDFTPIAQLGNATGAIAANRDFPANTLKEAIEYAKSHRGKVSYGSAGNGTTHHLSGVTITQLTGADLLHVPYKGTPQMVTDLVSGRIQLGFSTSSSFIPQVHAGKLKLIAINEDRRMPQMPDVQTVFEVVPGYDRLSSWFGYFGPAGLPQPIVRRLWSDIQKAASVPDVVEKLGSVGSIINTLPPEQFAALLRSQVEMAAKQMKAAGIVPE